MLLCSSKIKDYIYRNFMSGVFLKLMQFIKNPYSFKDCIETLNQSGRNTDFDITLSQMSPASKAAGSISGFQWEIKTPTETLSS